MVLEDWDNSPTINDDCTIKSRDVFFNELEEILNKINKKKNTGVQPINE
jgi:hypothetical protein